MSTVPVAATPVVIIEISGESVKVNGEPVVVATGVSLHQAGVHAAAQRVAQVLARPVRAIATDASSRTWLVVHPDGTATDVEVLEYFGAQTDAVANLETVEAMPAEDKPDLARVIRLAPVDDSRDVTVAAGDAATRAANAEQPLAVDEATAVPTVGEPVGPWRSSRRLLQLLLACIVVAALVLTVAVLATHESKPGPVAALAPTPAATPSSKAPPARTVRVVAAAGAGMVRLRVTASRLPVAAVIVVDPAGAAAPRRIRVQLTKAAQPITIKRVAPGKASWRVGVVDGAQAATGTVLVPRRPVSPPPVVSSPTQPAYTPSATQAPAPSHHHSLSNSGPVGPGGGGATGPVR